MHFAQGMISILLFISISSVAAEWEKIGEQEGITTFRKEIPGSPIVAFRGEAVIEDSMAKIAGVLEDVPREIEWMADVGTSYNIEITNEADRWEYNLTKTPWPLKNRDFVVHTLISFKKGPEPVLHIQMNSGENSKKPVTSDAVRGELMDSSFVLKSIGKNRTYFTCEIHADPKGIIPKWVVNLFQKSWPFDTITGLRKQLKKSDIKENERVAELMKAI
jgi:hypothetical protein